MEPPPTASYIPACVHFDNLCTVYVMILPDQTINIKSSIIYAMCSRKPVYDVIHYSILVECDKYIA